MPPEVFISYASKDLPGAESICRWLEAAGIRCWIAPRNVRVGIPYANSIMEGIDGARLMVLVFSSSANLSPHVPREVERASNRGMPLLPLRLEAVQPAGQLEYFLAGLHWLDMFAPPAERHAENVVTACRLHLGREGEATPVPTGPQPPAAWPAVPPAAAAPRGPGLFQTLAMPFRKRAGPGATPVPGPVPPPLPNAVVVAAAREAAERQAAEAAAAAQRDAERRAQEAARAETQRQEAARRDAERQQHELQRQREAEVRRVRQQNKPRLRELHGALTEMLERNQWRAARPFAVEILKIDSTDPAALAAMRLIESGLRVGGTTPPPLRAPAARPPRDGR